MNEMDDSRDSYEPVPVPVSETRSPFEEPFRELGKPRRKWPLNSKLVLAFISLILMLVLPLVILARLSAKDLETATSSYRGLFRDLFELQANDVDDFKDISVYGSSLLPWQLDTSRAYHLSRNGKWNSAISKQVREYEFIVSEFTDVSPAGVYQNMTLINGKFPGPVIEANAGDTILIKYINNASVPTSLHFHGLHQRGFNYMDGVSGITQCSIQPNQSFTYNFTLSEEQWGTFWYHSHYSAQYLEGIAGPLVIHSPEEDKMYDYDEELVIFLQEAYFKGSPQLLKEYIATNVENQEPIPDSGLIQGMNRFDCNKLQQLKDTEQAADYRYLIDIDNAQCRNSSEAIIPVQTERTYRLRIIDGGGFSEFDFSIDNHTLTVIEADGTNTEPLDIEVVRIANAQRYSVLVTPDSSKAADAFWMRAVMQTKCYDGSNPLLNTDLKAIFAYPSYTKETYLANLNNTDTTNKVSRYPTTSKSRQLDGNIRCAELDPKFLVPAIPKRAPEHTYFEHLDASFFIGAHQISLGYFNRSTYTSYNDTSTLTKLYEHSEAQELSTVKDESTANPNWADGKMVRTINKPEVIDLLVNNYDDGGHPFHLHGHTFWVLASGKGYFDPHMYKDINTTNPMRRDVVQVESFGWTLIRFVADNPGVWTFHCHILWHSAAGMLMQFNIMPEETVKQIPQRDWYDLCEKI